jgi:hypothetical protein
METLIVVYKSMSNSSDLAKLVNTFRLQNKNKWYQICFENETSGQRKYLKCYNTWVQISEVPEIETVMDLKPGEFVSNIQKGIDSLITKY